MLPYYADKIPKCSVADPDPGSGDFLPLDPAS
jgi:hypothetical protein